MYAHALEKAIWGVGGLASPSFSSAHCTAELEGFKEFACDATFCMGLAIGEGKDCQLRPVADGHYQG